jgi:hypothetical protein
MGRYSNIRQKRTDGIRNYVTVTYPDIPRRNSDVYVITTEGDRYDVLAQQYYNDSSYWWVISNANPQYINGSLFPPIGIQLRIPTDIQSIISSYNRINS